MDTDSRTDELVMRIANFLRGRVDAEALPYVSAEIAYLMSQMGNRSINDESEFYDFVNGLDCSLELRESLCLDARQLDLWKTLRAYQGMFSHDDCQNVIASCAKHTGINNFSVPTSLVPLIVKVLSSEPGGVMMDLACGRGVVMAEALKQDGELRAEGVDINRRSVNFAEMTVSPYGGRGRVACQSAFDYVEDKFARYDKVFCYPPFGLRAERNAQLERFQLLFPDSVLRIGAGTPAELMFALAAVYAMKDAGRAVGMLPEGPLFSQSSGAVAARRFMVESGNLDCVIRLPARMLERTGIDVSLLVFSKKENRKHVTMIDASGLAVKGRRFNTLASEDIDKIVNAVYGFADWTGWAHEHTKHVSVNEILGNGCVLSATHYFETADLPEVANAVKFGSVVTGIERGAAIGSRDLDDLVAHDEGVCYYLSPGNIVNGSISEDLTGMKELPKGAPVLEEGDLVLLRTGAPNKVAVFENRFDKPVVPSANLFICRLDRKKVDPWFLKAFLESADGERMLGAIAVGTAIRSISRRALEDLSVPCPPLVEQKLVAEAYQGKLREIRELESRLKTLRDELGKVYESGK